MNAPESHLIYLIDGTDDSATLNLVTTISAFDGQHIQKHKQNLLPRASLDGFHLCSCIHWRSLISWLAFLPVTVAKIRIWREANRVCESLRRKPRKTVSRYYLLGSVGSKVVIIIITNVQGQTADQASLTVAFPCYIFL